MGRFETVSYLVLMMSLPQFLKRIVIGLFFAGWVLPLWLATNIFLDWLRLLPWEPQGVHSFPYLHYVEECVNVTLAWLFCVLFYFGWHFGRRDI